MAKEDFCFTYYDGDAARDKAHMTRLCRGAYDDLISMQRKVGRMSLDTIKMVLSSDFDNCWVALKFVLKEDGEKNFYIEWVENSISMMRKSAKKQSETAKKRWSKENSENKSGNTKNDFIDATALKNNNLAIPKYEYENGDVNENIILNKNGFFYKDFLPNFFLKEMDIGRTIEFIKIKSRVTLSPQEVENHFAAFKIDNQDKKEWTNSEADLISHFRNSLKLNLQNGTYRQVANNGQQLTKSESKIAALQKLQ